LRQEPLPKQQKIQCWLLWTFREHLLQVLFFENRSHQSRKSQVQNSQQKAKESKEASTKLSEENAKKSSEKTTRHQASSTENESELMFFTTRI